MRRQLRGETGAIHILAGIFVAMVFTTVATSPYWVPAVASDFKGATGGWWQGQETAAPATPVVIPFIGPGLPADEEQRDCFLRVAKLASIRYTDKGWRSARHPEPEITGDPRVDRRTVNLWADDIRGYIAQFDGDFDKCKDLVKKPPIESTTSTEATPVVAGRYALTYQSATSGDPDCQGFALPTTMTVAQSGADLTITAEGQVSDQLTGSLDRSFSFSANGTRQVGGGLGVRMLGRFERDGNDTLVRNGSLSYQFESSCTFSFTGKRTG